MAQKYDVTKAAKRAERADRKANDPWFGKRRSAGEMGRAKSKAAKNRRACRGKVSYD